MADATSPSRFSVEMTNVNLDRLQSWIDQGRIDPSQPITIREMKRSRLTHRIKDGVKLLARVYHHPPTSRNRICTNTIQNAAEFRTPIHITVSRASAAAIEAVEAVGGTIQTRYYTRPSIKRILQGETHPTLSLLSQEVSFSLPLPSSTGTESDAVDTQATSSLQTPHAVGLQSAPPNSSDAIRTLLKQYKYRLPDPASRKDLEYYRDPAHRGYLSYQLQEGQGPSLFFKSPLEVQLGAGKRRVKVSSKKASESKIW